MNETQAGKVFFYQDFLRGPKEEEGVSKYSQSIKKCSDLPSTGNGHLVDPFKLGEPS